MTAAGRRARALEVIGQAADSIPVVDAQVLLPSPAAIAELAGRELAELDRLALLDKLVAEFTAAAQAYVSGLYQLRRATIRDVVDGECWDGEARYRRALRVQAVAGRLGISVTQVYGAVKDADPRRP